MKVLVTGAGGMLGRALVPELERAGHSVLPFSRQELDVTRASDSVQTLEFHRPDAVVQCAAYTLVDDAEDQQELAFRINTTGAANVAAACQRVGALFVYPSTDYVFSGCSDRPYLPMDPVSPLGAYGRSKAEGEREALRAENTLIVRTSWLYGSGGRNFVDSILKNARIHPRLRVVNDQIGLPTWTGSLAQTLARLLKIGAVGTFHAADAGEAISWCSFAAEILEKAGISTELIPVGTAEYGSRAPRPRYSVLDCSDTVRVLRESLPMRENSLSEYLRRLGA